MNKRISCLPMIVLLQCFAVTAHADRTKTDVIHLANGDRITGEIKSLDYNSLKVSTSNVGTITIEWPAIRSITSDQSFTVEDREGNQYTGLFDNGEDQQLTINLVVGDKVTLPLMEVVRMYQIETGFWNRINGSMSVGLNYTKASETSVINANMSATYRSPSIESTLTLSANSTKTETGTTDRDQIANSLRWLRPGNKYWNLLTSWDRNEELGIDSRIQAGLGVGRHLIQRRHSAVDLTLGLSFNNEWVNGDSTSRQSAEGTISTEWRVFRFSDPETSLVSTLTLFPSITESGRWRSEFNITLSREIFKDFTIDLSYYNSYDSDPPDENAANKDYGIVTSASYKF